ncbi:MAG TPA: thioredoxin domain-containing protein [Gammaproteobacteria bacterium]|nr:thioredoxin domain-containing protein [Gammaproteobacteria bacterium]
MPNALADALSPYLLQHADNPVDWLQWGPEALTRARTSGRPILLSIGYSACHWCHVMAHESFEDPETAALMNRLFVNVKVDREERPDLDRVHQLAHQLLMRRPGGWPLTLFLTHDDQVPFFGGTYFPPESRYGLPGFQQLLLHVDRLYRERLPELRNQNERLRAALEDLAQAEPPLAGALTDAPLEAATQELAASFDPVHGGFGGAPKFPHPANLSFLLREHQRRTSRALPAEEPLAMALTTLTRMAEGGIRDQLGGGFARYAVDASWTIPHFEKMLYDNGPLLGLYAEAWALTGDPLYAETADTCAAWVLDAMRLPGGGFASSLDADSEGHEGRYYVWDRAEMADLLAAEDLSLCARHWGLDRPPNFEGAWHLVLATPASRLAEETALPPAQVEERLATCRQRLLTARAERIPPGRDDKVLTAWNALMIRGLTSHARWRPQQAAGSLAAARACLDFLQQHVWRDGRLLAGCKDGRSAGPGYLDDHAFLLAAVLDLATLAPVPGDIPLALQLADALLEHFEDRAAGGFLFTAHDHERLIQRPRSFTDDALPSGNGVAAEALLRLGHWLGEARLIDAGERAVRAAGQGLLQMPGAHAALLPAVALCLKPPEVIVLRGPDAAELAGWRTAAQGRCLSGRDILALPSDWAPLPGVLAAYPPVGHTTAWVCRGTACSAPVTSRAALLDMLAD